jgi:alkylation response protein AidB-like acyl-CoA dehydrogenase
MYRAPIAEMRFVLEQLLEAGSLARLRKYADFSMETAEAVLEEAGRFGAEVLAPLNQPGDREGAQWTPHGVQMPTGFRDAYRKYVEGGWPQLNVDTAHGGQGAPLVLASAVEEIWCSSNVALMLCPLLSRGAIEALLLVGSSQLQKTYLPRMLSGEWSGTMNLTEPQAGSDLGAIRMRAAPAGDHYLLTGQKIFISYGDHDMTSNIVHLVLARIDGAPAGVRGLSLFVVPKILPDERGLPGARNDVRCVSIEHKLGIRASPTCVLAYGDNGGAKGHLVGAANRGLEYMFIMMNAARLAMGFQGVGLAEAALQRADAWARNRVQGKAIGMAATQAQPIIRHPDVRRTLLSMRASIEAMRALALYAAMQFDLSEALPNETAQRAALLRGELLIPIVKGWCTEQAFEIVSQGLQVHGGMGYIEETGIAQILRDVRITTIYEGTTAIQANDLLGRKLKQDGGAAMRALLDEIEKELRDFGIDSGRDAPRPELTVTVAAAREAVSTLRATTAMLLSQMDSAPPSAYAVSVPYLRLCGFVLGGWLMARAAGIAASRLGSRGGGGEDAAFLRTKLQTARCYAAVVLPQALALTRIVRSGGTSIADSDVEAI